MNDSIDENAILAALGAYAANVAKSDSPDIAFRYAEQTSRELIGHRLFTIMQFNADIMEVRRCYSSNTNDYPAGGRKTKRDSQWGRHVLEQGRFFIGYNINDIRANFTDHEVIERLGLGSVLNMPIRSLGKTIGTMNLLDEAGFYRPNHVTIATIIVSTLASVLMTLDLGE